MNPIPSWAQSSTDPNQVSLLIVSIGKSVAGVIVFLGAIGYVDPAVAGQAWGGFVQEVVTAIPVGYAVWHSGQAVWAVFRKLAIRLFAKAPIDSTTVTAQQ